MTKKRRKKSGLRVELREDKKLRKSELKFTTLVGDCAKLQSKCWKTNNQTVNVPERVSKFETVHTKIWAGVWATPWITLNSMQTTKFTRNGALIRKHLKVTIASGRKNEIVRRIEYKNWVSALVAFNREFGVLNLNFLYIF